MTNVPKIISFSIIKTIVTDTIKHFLYTKTITLPIRIIYYSSLRLLKDILGNCTFKEKYSETKYQYFCEVIANTKNIKKIKVELNFDWNKYDNIKSQNYILNCKSNETFKSYLQIAISKFVFL